MSCFLHQPALHSLVITHPASIEFLAPFVGDMNLAQTTRNVLVYPASAAALHLPHFLPMVPPKRHNMQRPAAFIALMLLPMMNPLVTSCCCRLPQLLMHRFRPD